MRRRALYHKGNDCKIYPAPGYLHCLLVSGNNIYLPQANGNKLYILSTAPSTAGQITEVSLLTTSVGTSRLWIFTGHGNIFMPLYISDKIDIYRTSSGTVDTKQLLGNDDPRPYHWGTPTDVTGDNVYCIYGGSGSRMRVGEFNMATETFTEWHENTNTILAGVDPQFYIYNNILYYITSRNNSLYSFNLQNKTFNLTSLGNTLYYDNKMIGVGDRIYFFHKKDVRIYNIATGAFLNTFSFPFLTHDIYNRDVVTRVGANLYIPGNPFIDSKINIIETPGHVLTHAIVSPNPEITSNSTIYFTSNDANSQQSIHWIWTDITESKVIIIQP